MDVNSSKVKNDPGISQSSQAELHREGNAGIDC